MSLEQDELDAIWERLARAVDEAGDRSELFLAKLALLLIRALDDRAAAEAAIEAALRDLR